ncbi:glycosyltransferase family 4 protein [Paracoccus marcusii]|uniref:glycosyltransferase family 4 protein n=1 Tax=Paracoccus marcusii TaxID=59779 RepID=UPI002ED59BBF|nr:glycosyltransferase family 4 protein [Paracoccus marcusii]
MADLQAQIAASGLDGQLELAGRVEADRLADLYRKTSIFALATRYEGYGIVFDEALSHGLPIVSTRAGAVPGTVPADAGLLVAPEDAPALAQALRRMLTDPAERAARAAAAARAGRRCRAGRTPRAWRAGFWTRWTDLRGAARACITAPQPRRPR